MRKRSRIRAGAGWLLAILFPLTFFLFSGSALGRIYIDINAPSVQKFKVATPDFKPLGTPVEHPELSAKLSEVLASDLDLSGYFIPLEKEAFLEEKGGGITLEDIRFKDWSVIGAELLIKGGYTCVGNSMEVEVRLFDVFWGRQIMGKRVLGDVRRYRRLMHRVGNEIIEKLTGHPGMFLTKLAFVGNGTGQKEIYRCDYDGHNVKQLTEDRSICLLPRWSPDGERIMYNSYRDGGPMLYLEDLDSGRVTRVSARAGLNIGAAWAPDGKKVALTLSLEDNPDIFLIDLNGKILKRLTSHWGIDVSPTFSPDGKRIAFVSNRSGSPQIYVLDLITGSEQRLTFEGNYNTSPCWSVLNKIAYVSMQDGRFDIYTLDPEGGQVRRVTANNGNNEDPCWSPDGRYMVFSSNREGPYHIYLMSANGRHQRRITHERGDQTSPSWAR